MIEEIQRKLRDSADPIRAGHAQRYFKTGPGEYAEGDKFLGNNVPTVRKLSRDYWKISMEECLELLKSEWHEERLLAVFILVIKFQKGSEPEQAEIFEIYLENSKYINNWDLVDSSAHKIVGPYLAHRPEKMMVLNSLANSELVWDRRIAMISTAFNIARLNSDTEALELAETLLHDDHDLIHKAVGWMLREVGSRISEEILLDFLDKHVHEMPRVMLRYSIEKLDDKTRKYYLNK